MKLDKLYEVKTRGLEEFYVLADSFDDAEAKVDSHLMSKENRKVTDDEGGLIDQDNYDVIGVYLVTSNLIQ